MMRHVDERIVVESSVRQLPHRAAVKQGIAVVGVVGLAAGALLLSASAAPAATTAFNPFAVNNGFTSSPKAMPRSATPSWKDRSQPSVRSPPEDRTVFR